MAVDITEWMTPDGGVLRCPDCGGGLEFVPSREPGSDGLPHGSLVCMECSRTYPVIRGIPRFVDSDEYVSNFSFEWKVHKRTQFDAGKRRESETNFYLRFGKDPEFFRGKRVLDVGVGSGRYAQVPLEAGAEVWGVDLSYAVEVARENLAGFPKARVAQADVFNLPFAPESFDVIYSFGVLHHTPDPRGAFEALLKLLKPGGVICLTLYPDYGMYHNSRLVRKLTTRLPASVLYPLSVVATALLYVPYRFLGLRLAWLPISLSPKLREAILDTYDCYSPKYQFTYGVDEVFAWFRDAGLHEIEARPQPVTVLGWKAGD